MNQRIFVGLFLLFKLISAESQSDAIPVFEKCSEYHAKIFEEQEVGTIIFQVAATVKTTDSVEYSLSFNDKFKIDAITGQITTNYKFDRDAPKNEKEESVTVCASNKNKPELTGTCEISIYIHDLNDNAPIFQKPHYKQDFLINSQVKDVIFKVQATDIDAGEYSIVDYSSDSDLFSVDSSGTIFLEKDVNHTPGDVYNVTLRAFNPNNTKKFTLTMISFKVIKEENPTAPLTTAATIDYKTTKMSINTLSVNNTTTKADNGNGDSMNETISNDDAITNMKKTIIRFLVKDYNSLAIFIMTIVMIINIFVCFCCCFSRRKRVSHDLVSRDNSIFFFGSNCEIGESFNMIEGKSMNNIEPLPNRDYRNPSPISEEEAMYQECPIAAIRDSEVFDSLTFNSKTRIKSSTPNESFYKTPTTFIPNRIIFPELHPKSSSHSHHDQTYRTSIPVYANIPIIVKK